MTEYHNIIKADPTLEGWHGYLNLVYGYRNNETQILHQFAQAPLKVQRPFYPEGKRICHSIILHTAGGIVGGDRVSLDIELQPHAQALITTATAGKIYRTNGQEAQQTINIKVAKDACLEWFPQETIVFNDARFRQDIRIELETGASLFLWEINRFGRTARGEKFLQGEWRSRTEIWQENRPLWIDRQQLKGSEEMWHSRYTLAGQPVIATFTAIGQPLTPEMIAKARSIFPPSLSEGEGLKMGLTRLPDGLLCRYRGTSTTDAKNWFIQLSDFLRQSCAQYPGDQSRVWPFLRFL